jgi:hypothetical protein
MPLSKSKKVGRVPARQGPPRAPVPPIDEIQEIIRTQIQYLIDGFAVPSGKDIAAIRRGENWKPSLRQVKEKNIRREIECLGRAIELLGAVADLDLSELARAVKENPQSPIPTPQ